MAAEKYWFRIAIRLGLWLTAMTLPPAALGGAANEAEAQAVATLEVRLLSLDGVRANFTQQTRSPRGAVLEAANGRLEILKPNFRWEILAPYPQIILARGKDIEIYDPDLEQVTQRTLTAALDEAPLALLTQSTLDLAAHYQVAYESGEMPLYTLRPRALDALFAQLDLVFMGERLLSLTILDHSGQQTIIRFTEFTVGQAIEADAFQARYPPGTDFVRG